MAINRILLHSQKIWEKSCQAASSGMQCKFYDLGLTDWPSGEHKAVTSLTFTAPVNDGTADYPAGVQVSDYTIYVP
jgi:hypothetical protein